MLRIRFLLVVASLFAMPFAAGATVTGVSVSPDPIVVNERGSALVTLRWRVEVTTSLPVTLESASGTVIGGPVAETPGRRLSKRVSAAGVSTHRFSDRIRISRAAIAALASGSTVVYQRSWNDGSGAVVENVALTLGSGGELSVRNASLRFDDGSYYAIVDEGAPLAAVLRLTSAGAGRFDGIWQVSGPAGTGSAAFRPVGRVRTTLAGSRTSVIESPALPTDRPGLYRVRLLPGPSAGADTAGTFPILTYVVTGAAGPDALGLLSPAPGKAVTPSTRFSWDGVPGASLYRLEFFRASGTGGLAGRRVAAVDLPGGATSARLKPFTFDRIRRADAALWRVVALDANGRPVAASPARRMGGGASFGASR
ncbi:MAG: hypothetical protein LJE62_08450 [Silicimonas sp.]|jgi:hypothetical protein|nr:hypothetical protein [Silicimonas sp.]